MAQVPVYNQNEVKKENVPIEYSNVHADASSFGSGGLDTLAKGVVDATDTFGKIQKASADAQMTSTLADTNIALYKANEQWKTDNQSNPTDPKAVLKLGQIQDSIIQQNSKGISPWSKDEWAKQTGILKGQYQKSAAEYGVQQTVVNTSQALDDTVTKAVSQAQAMGQSGASLKDIGQFGLTTVKSLKDATTPILGEVTANEKLKDANKKIISAYVDGQIDKNPQQALQSLQDPNLTKLINDPKELELKQQAAVSKFKAQKETNIVMGESNLIKQFGGIANKAVSGQLNFGELTQFVSQNKGSKFLTPDVVRQLFIAGDFKIDTQHIFELSGLPKSIAKDPMSVKVLDGEASFDETKNFVSKYKNQLSENQIKEFYRQGGFNVSPEHVKLDQSGNIVPPKPPKSKQSKGVSDNLPTITIPNGKGGLHKENSLPSINEILGHSPNRGKKGGLKETPEEKYEAYNNLINYGSKMVSGQAFKGQTIQHSLHAVANYQHLLNTAYNSGYINNKQFQQLSTSYASSLNDNIAKNFTAGQHKEGWGMWEHAVGTDYGYSRIQSYPTDDKGFKAQLNDNYYHELTIEANKRSLTSFYDLNKLSPTVQKTAETAAFNTALAKTKATAHNPFVWFSAENSTIASGVHSMLGKDAGNQVLNNVAKYQTANPHATHKDIAEKTHQEINNAFTSNLHNAQNKLLNSPAFQTKALASGKLPHSPEKEQYKTNAKADLQQTYLVLMNKNVSQKTKDLITKKYKDAYGVNPHDILGIK